MVAAMPTYRAPSFTPAELAALNLWRVPVVGQVEAEPQPLPEEQEPEVVEIIEPEPIEEQEVVPVMTVEEIEAIQKQAYDEGFANGQQDGFQQGREEGLKKGYEEGYRSGFETGQKAAYDEHSGILKEKAEQFTRLMACLAEPFERLDEEVEKELVKLAISIATQIIRREIKHNPGQIVFAVREAISALPLASQKITLHIHPEDAELVRSALALDEMSTPWTITEDPLITRGGCKVNTDVSHINATIEHRLAAVIANVLGSEREPDRPL